MSTNYLVGSMVFFITTMIYILFIAAGNKEEEELVKLQWRQDEYDRIQRGFDEVFENMRKITAGRPE